MSDQEYYDLLADLETTKTSVFDVLDIGRDERDMTRVLAWLLDPQGSHGGETRFLDQFLNCYGITNFDSDSATVQTFWVRNSSEIDIVIEGKEILAGVEIKTREPESKSKFEKEKRALDSAVSSQEKWTRNELLYLTYSEDDAPEFAKPIATWKEVLDELQKEMHAVGTLYDAGFLRDIRHWISETVFEELISISKEAEISIKYPDRIQQDELEVNPEAYKKLRKQFFNRLQDFFVNQGYESNWEGQFTGRNRAIDTRTKYIRIAHQQWMSPKKLHPPIRVEIAGSEARLRHGSSYGNHGQYKPESPHFEMTLVAEKEFENQRDELRDSLSKDSKQKLRNDGFNLVADLLSDIDGPDRNPYHMYSKIIEIDFENPQRTEKELESGLETLLSLGSEIGDFVQDE